MKNKFAALNLFSSTSVIHLFQGLALVSLASASAHASSHFTDFTSWTAIEDPAHPNFSSSSSSTSATFTADGGPIPDGTDIGFASIDGNTAATSTQGFVFSPSSSFTLAVSYDLSLTGAVGNIGLGFGIGEDITGMNSAGIFFLYFDLGLGSTNAVVGAARVNDVNTGGNPPIVGPPDRNGTMFLSYDGGDGNITLGWANALGAASADLTDTTFTGSTVSDNWNDEPLLVSIFMRSDAFGGTAWTRGTAEGVFSDFRVISGSPMTIPEPSSAMLGIMGLGLLTWRRQRS